MNYASLTDAYGIESFKKKKKKEINETISDNEIFNNNETTDYKIEEYKKNFSTCEPIQPPHYKLPISEKVMQNYNNSYQNFLRDRKVIELKEKKNLNKTINISPPSNNNKHNINIYENLNKIKSENVKEIEPYYDEDLDNYLNINDFNIMNDNYNDDICNNEKKKFMNKKYNLKTQDAFNFNLDDYIIIPKNKKNINKINTINQNNNNNSDNFDDFDDFNDDITSDIISQNKNYINNDIDNIDEFENEDITNDRIIENFKNNKNYKQNKYNRKQPPILEEYSPEITTNKKNYINIFYKNIINIGILVLIGIFIIFLLDLLTELALHKGMKQTVEVLIPLLEELKDLKSK